MKLPKSAMTGILYEGLGEIILDTIIDHTRWSVCHELIFKYQDKYYSAGYSVGATEHQDESPWEYDEEVECTEVHKVPKMIEVWEPII